MRKGFTLIEVMIVAVIIFILTGIVLTTFVTYNKTQALDKDTETIVETLRQARSLTLASKNAAAYGVHFASSTVTLFTGPTYSLSNTSNQVFNLQTSDIVVDLNLVNESTNVIFNKLTGETNQSGTVIISSAVLSKTKTVTIYKTGTIQFK
jgi:prepilin-type N-terminal cleavage/methylation domain-containing protein